MYFPFLCFFPQFLALSTTSETCKPTWFPSHISISIITHLLAVSPVHVPFIRSASFSLCTPCNWHSSSLSVGSLPPFLTHPPQIHMAEAVTYLKCESPRYFPLPCSEKKTLFFPIPYFPSSPFVPHPQQRNPSLSALSPHTSHLHLQALVTLSAVACGFPYTQM